MRLVTCPVRQGNSDRDPDVTCGAGLRQDVGGCKEVRKELNMNTTKTPGLERYGGAGGKTGLYDPNWVREFYNQYGEKEWGRLVQSPAHEIILHIHRYYLEQYIRPGDRVLEIGAGAGRFTQILAELGARIVVADISPRQLELNRQYAERFGFDLAVMDRLELDVCDMSVFEDGTFDAVICYGAPLSYVFDRRDVAMGEILRVVRPGGVVLLGVMSRWGAMQNSLPEVIAESTPEERANVVRTGDIHPSTYRNCTHHAHLFSSEELRSFLESCGAEIVVMSASNSSVAAWGDRLAGIRANPDKWRELLQWEVKVCREPGCLDIGQHLLAVVRRPWPR